MGAAVPPRSALPAGSSVLPNLLGIDDVTESEDDDGARPLNSRQRALRTERAEAAWNRVMRRLEWVLMHLSRARVLAHWKQQAALEGPESAAQASAPTGPPRAQREGHPPPRRDDLTYVGQPMRPSQARVWPLTVLECPHTQYLQAGGGRRGASKIYWWTCLGCGQRWARVAEAEATDGTTLPTRETSHVRATPLRPKAAARAKPLVPTAATSSGAAGDADDFEMIPQLDRPADDLL